MLARVLNPHPIALVPMTTSSLRVLAVSSGKGGVGKTNLVANLAYGLSKRGQNVLVVDADLGLNNIDILLGLAPRFHIGHVLSGEKNIEDIIVRGPANLRILPAGDGLQELTQLETEKKMLLMDELDRVSQKYDFLIFDTGAGISQNVTYFCSAAHEIILVATTEPTSLTVASGFIQGAMSVSTAGIALTGTAMNKRSLLPASSPALETASSTAPHSSARDSISLSRS